MTLKRKKTILFLGGSFLCYISVGMILYGILRPVRLESSDPSALRLPAAHAVKQDEGALPGLARFSTVWSKPLQNPVFDAPPPPPEEEKKPEQPPIQARLLATVAEGDTLAAMLKLPVGRTRMLRAGETFDNQPGNVHILEVREKSILLKMDGFDDTTITLELGK